MLGQVCATIINTVLGLFVGKGDKRRLFTPDDFIPKWNDLNMPTVDPATPIQSMDDMKTVLKQIAGTYGKPKRRLGSKRPKK
jgi:hypothetical protein